TTRSGWSRRHLDAIVKLSWTNPSKGAGINLWTLFTFFAGQQSACTPRCDRLGTTKLALWVLGMQRRDALAILAGMVVARPLAVRAQHTPKLPIIGFLGPN